MNPDPPVALPPGRRGLLQVLGVWEGAAIGIGVAIGAGIFRLPGYVASYLPDPGMVLLAWVVGWALVLGDAVILSELGTRMPRAGGWYVYVEKGYGRFPAFVYGWAYTLVVDPASSAALVVILGEYLASVLGIAPMAGRLAAIGTTVAIFLLQLIGVRFGSRLQDALTYTKLILLVAVGGMALLVPAATPGLIEGVTRPVTGIIAFGLALQGVLWTFEGYANFTTLAEESVDARRTLPRALILGTLAIGATYVLVNAAYLHVLGRDALSASILPGADMAAKLIGSDGNRIFLLLAIFVGLGSLNGAALSAPRVAYALSRSGLGPRVFTRVTRRGTPDAATIWFALAWGVYAWFGTAEGLVAVSIFIGAIANVAITATVFKHRRADKNTRTDCFRAPWYPVLPVVLLLAWGTFAAIALYEQGWSVGYGLALTAVAFPVYFLWFREKARS